ncbi:putative MFS family arabinose efflux permease [Nitrobacteraceae bacterium AZCC 2161]
MNAAEAIPDVLPDEAQYTRALSLSRLAYDMESLVSPILAAALLTIITFNLLFVGTVIGFLCSAALALNLSVAAAGAMVIVNTVVLVRGVLHGSDTDVAIALACFGGGSMMAALLLPKLLDRVPDRPVMLSAAGLLAAALLCFAVLLSTSTAWVWPGLLVTWAVLGIAYSAVMTPSGRLLRRSAHAADRPAVFAAQFALSHACWLLTYPLASWLGSAAGLVPTLLVLAAITLSGVLLARAVWPASDDDVVPHRHPDLPSDHPHMHGKHAGHAHAFVIDDLHHRWP